MTTAIILMAGSGRRMGKKENKMLLSLNNKPIYQYAIDLFKDKVKDILLVVSEVDYPFFKSLNLEYRLIKGGKTRQESVLNALKEVKTNRVLIHDGARILASSHLIDTCLNTKSKAYFVGIRPVSTIRYDSTNHFKTLDRSHLYEVQTPQGGSTDLFLKSALEAFNNNLVVTDDISTILNEEIEVIEGEFTNIKVTTPFDLRLAEFILKEGLV